MKLSELRNVRGAKHRRKRVGCGESSGHGKTSGRGGKGQSARSGSSIKVGFEGGQTRLILRMPKRGFNHAHRDRFATVNIAQLNHFEDSAVVDEAALRSEGLVKGDVDGVKILGDGELKKKLTICATKFSAGARTKIEAAGGRCQIIESPTSPKTPVTVSPQPQK